METKIAVKIFTNPEWVERLKLNWAYEPELMLNYTSGSTSGIGIVTFHRFDTASYEKIIMIDV